MKIYLILFLILTQISLVKASQWPVVARDTTINQVKVSPIFYNMGKYDPYFKCIYFYPKIENNSGDTLVIESVVSHNHAKVVFAKLGVGPVELPAKIAPGEFAFLSVYVDMAHYNINDIIKHEILVYTSRIREPFRINYRAELRSRFGDSIPDMSSRGREKGYEVKRAKVLTEEEKKEIQKKRESGEIQIPPRRTLEEIIEASKPFKFFIGRYNVTRLRLVGVWSGRRYDVRYSDIQDAYFLGIYSTLDIDIKISEESLKQNFNKSIEGRNLSTALYVTISDVLGPEYLKDVIFPAYADGIERTSNSLAKRDAVINTFSFVFKEITEEGTKYYITSILGRARPSNY